MRQYTATHVFIPMGIAEEPAGCFVVWMEHDDELVTIAAYPSREIAKDAYTLLWRTLRHDVQAGNALVLALRQCSPLPPRPLPASIQQQVRQHLKRGGPALLQQASKETP